MAKAQLEDPDLATLKSSSSLKLSMTPVPASCYARLRPGQESRALWFPSHSDMLYSTVCTPSHILGYGQPNALSQVVYAI